MNLMKIVSTALWRDSTTSPGWTLRLWKDTAGELICLSACLAGEVQRNLARGMYEEGKKAALRYQSIFGEGNFFLELQDHGIPLQKTVNQGLLRMSQDTGIPLVATNDCHYIYREDEKSHDILLCIQTGKKVADENRMRYEGGQLLSQVRGGDEEYLPLCPGSP